MITFFLMPESDCIVNMLQFSFIHSFLNEYFFSFPCLGYYKGWYSACWRRQWHPTPVLLPGESHGWSSLIGFGPWGRAESDMTERLSSSSSACWLPVSFEFWVAVRMLFSVGVRDPVALLLLKALLYSGAGTTDIPPHQGRVVPFSKPHCGSYCL